MLSLKILLKGVSGLEDFIQNVLIHSFYLIFVLVFVLVFECVICVVYVHVNDNITIHLNQI